ncbi:MAG TPA: flagellar FliJ family protein [Planctomycetota bacterium]|nr:flagellar FliJ family protein [Planctomycetota bacterium]
MASPRRFRFPLARVLSVRSIEETAALARLAEAISTMRQAEAREREALASAESCAAELSRLRTSPTVPVAECLGLEALGERLAAAVQAAAVERVRCLEAREQARAAHAAARTRVRSLERLRERRLAEHAQARRLEESKSMDEVASRRTSPPAAPPEI